MQRLSNDELATRTREANRRRGERHRERLTIAGRAALTVWLPVGLRREFVSEAASCGVGINELATRLIEKGMRERKNGNFPHLPDPDISSNNLTISEPETADLFATPDPEPQTPVVVADTDASTPATVSVDSGRTAIMMLVAGMLADGLTGAEIARRLNADGYRAVSGKELVGHNLLREYRTWRDKTNRNKSTAV